MRARVLAASALTLLVALTAARAADPAPAAPARSLGPNSSIGIAPDGSRLNTPGQANILNVPAPTTSPTISTGLFPRLGDTLLEHGIDFHGVVLDKFLANPSAGSQPGNTNNLGLVRPAVDIDLSKLIGLPGGNVHAADTIYFYRSNIPGMVINTGGELTGYQTTPFSAKTVITLLTYEQKSFGGKLSTEIGRANVSRYYFIPNSLDPFSYPSPVLNSDADFNSPPYGVWSGNASYRLTPTWYLQAGAFEDNYRRAVARPYAFGVRDSSGAQVLGELGYRSEFDNARYPANMELGFEWNTRGTDLTNQKGKTLTATRATVATGYPGGGVIFWQGGKVLWRDGGPRVGPPKNIQVFSSLDVAVDKPQPIDLDALVGVNFTGFIPGRPLDAFGVQARYQRLSQIEASFEQTVRRRIGGLNLTEPRDNFAFEAVGRIVLTRWAFLSPFVQYYVNPDNYIIPFQRNRASDGFMAGIFGTIAIGPALGTSRKPF